MNVARSIFMRKGYLLTALAVAVLLAGSSGTAWAQTGTKITASSRFSGSSGTLPEGADADELDKPRPLEVTIRRTTKTRNDPYNYPPSTGTEEHLEIQFEYDGDPGLPEWGSQLRWTIRLRISQIRTRRNRLVKLSRIGHDEVGKDNGASRGGQTERMVVERPNVEIAETEIVLTFEDGRNDDGDWIPEKFSMTLTKGDALGAESEYTEAVTDTQSGLETALLNPFVNDFTSSKFTVTITDDDPQPVFKFHGRERTAAHWPKPTSSWPRAANGRWWCVRVSAPAVKEVFLQDISGEAGRDTLGRQWTDGE